MGKSNFNPACLGFGLGYSLFGLVNSTQFDFGLIQIINLSSFTLETLILLPSKNEVTN